jgi:hypothetical protein
MYRKYTFYIQLASRNITAALGILVRKARLTSRLSNLV